MLDAYYTALVHFWRVLQFTISGLFHTLDDCLFRGRSDTNWEEATLKQTRTCAASINGEEWAVVTGAAAGLGKEVAKVLLQSGYNVIVACRSDGRGKEAVEGILQEMKEAGTPSSKAVVAYTCDLGDLRSVVGFLEKVEGSGKKVTLYVGNAAVLATPYSLTPQGYIHQVGVNFYANAVLLDGFLRLMKGVQGGRAIVVSSRTVFEGQVAVAELAKQTEQDVDKGDLLFNRYHIYGNTKLAMMLYVESLIAPLTEWNTANPSKQVKVTVVHPGCLTTSIARSLPLNRLPGVDVMHSMTTFSPAEGAYYTLNAGFDESPLGSYYHMSRRGEKPPGCGDEKLVREVAGYVSKCRSAGYAAC